MINNIKSTGFLGISATTGQNRYTFALFNGSCEIVSIGNTIKSNLVNYLTSFDEILVALNLPSQLNRYLSNYIKPQQHILPVDFNQVFIKRTRKTPEQTQSSPEKIKQPVWFQRNRKLIQLFEQLDIKPLPNDPPIKQWFSSSAEIIYHILLGTAPSNSRAIEGRIQRQLFLYNLSINVPDPMAFFEEITRYRLLHGDLNYETVHAQSELDAIVLAYLAWLSWYHPEKTRIIATTNDENIIFPITETTSTHTRRYVS